MQPADELTGTFNALNETTNFKPTQREEIGVIHPSYMPTQGDEIGVIHPSYKPDPRGYDTGPIGSLSETFGEGDPKMLGPISGEGPFKPQGIDAKGSVIVGDNHFKPGRSGDSLMGMRNGVRENIGANSLMGMRNGVRENIGANSGPGGSTYMTETFAGSFSLIKGDLPLENDPFQPAAGMDSFGRSLNPVAELGSTSGPGGSTYMTGQFEMPTDNLGTNSGPGGTSY
ncbi:hypothetical protein [Synechococcus sp. MIT S9503]|uniref:hypothetical protein n=1 Tax=Synechococcus sp. MIT S9503 TaxID=3082547 RepID=UPI0039A58A81